MNMNVKESYLWIMKKILQQRNDYQQVHVNIQTEFKMMDVYLSLKNVEPKVRWYNLLCHKMAWPRTQFIMWLACNESWILKRGYLNLE